MLRELVITTGDPQGIGPEVSAAGARALLKSRDEAACVLVGDPTRLRALVPDLEWIAPDEPLGVPGLYGLATPDPEPLEVPPPSPAGGAAALRILEMGLERARGSEGRALVTGPVSKEAIDTPDRPFTGHTGWLARRLGASCPVMLFDAPAMRVALATVHVPLREVPERLSVDGLVDILTVLRRDLASRFGIRDPEIAVLGLNPHAGEGGLLGREEQEIIEPAMERFREAGGRAAGPFSADTFFREDQLARFDAVLAMYHDQGLLPLKALSFGQAVNVTLGLPLIRTSVDHGTGFDIAGQGRADPGSMTAALDLAWRLLGDSPAAIG